MAKKALVVGVDRFSQLIDWSDRSTCVLFGDGAGAVVLSASQGESGIISSNIHSDGHKWDMLYAPGEIGKSPFAAQSHQKLSDEEHRSQYLTMAGNETFKVAVRTMVASIKEALHDGGIEAEDIDLLIPHQANLRIIKATRERLKLPEESVYINLDKYGNTSAGSIPLALDEAYRAGRIKSGDVIVFVAFGGGLTWSSAAVRW